MTMADRIAIMSDGRLQQVGTPQEVYDVPANLFVAAFIGTPAMNTIPGAVVIDDGAAPAVDVGGGRVPFPATVAAVPAAGARVVVGTRREPLGLARAGQLDLDVRAVEWLGHECLVFGTVGDTPVGVRQTGMATVRAGDGARLAVDPEAVHAFD